MRARSGRDFNATTLYGRRMSRTIRVRTRAMMRQRTQHISLLITIMMPAKKTDGSLAFRTVPDLLNSRQSSAVGECSTLTIQQSSPSCTCTSPRHAGSREHGNLDRISSVTKLLQVRTRFQTNPETVPILNRTVAYQDEPRRTTYPHRHWIAGILLETIP